MRTAISLLAEFIERAGLKQKEVAQALGVSRTVVYFWLKETVTPSLEHRRSIEKWTGGYVPAESWEEKTEPSVIPFSGELKPLEEIDEDGPTDPAPAATGTEHAKAGS